MNTYFAIFLIATCASVVLTPLVRRMCERGGWLDQPGAARRVHHRAVPRLGGLAVFLSVLVALASLSFVDNLITRAVVEQGGELYVALVPAALVMLFGIYDDLRGTGARAKFIALGAGGALFYALGGRIELLSVPLVGTVELPAALSFVLTVVWVVGVANAFNLIDGVDGLAAGAGLFAALVMLVVALMLGHPLVAVAACALCGALVGFLRYNFNPASIFLGDSGALFVGFMLAALSVNGAQKASTAVAVAIPLLAFGVPVVDTGFTLVRRYLSGKPLFEGDREHIHHMLLARGWSQRRVACVLYGACALFGLAALMFVGDAGRATGLLLFIIGVAVVLAVGRLRYPEVDEIRASVRRNFGDRRRRAANNIRVRRAARSVSEAATLGDLFGAVRELLEFGEFAYANMRLGDVGGANFANAAAVLAREAGSEALRGVRLREGVLCWEWERGDVDASEVIASRRFWTLRLPLSTAGGDWGYVNLYRGCDADALLLDVDYLCNLLQREMAGAAERILGSAGAVRDSADEADEAVACEVSA
ncbi:MAG: undecaprenyl/decaprenyl-phosphate alpha-N-acetylglucosaminyl 1-phosphate transferase [Acidobacteria bacterium]|nr:undecaprenyl/decaprenyl-phosphate alpha-N-acetylglucosaminyl 1-phosphate transferase [Acidobacteriota bacterium]